MASHIVSWSDNEICISPVPSSAASIVSFDSTFSDTYPSHLQMSPTASEALGPTSAELGAQHTSLPGFSEEGKTPGSGHTTPDDSFIRHDAYFFNDGNVTFLIDGTLYCVHRYFFSRDSVYFSTRFAQLGIPDHEALSTIISIGDIKRNDFEALLSVLYPTNFEGHELTYEQWKSVLHLSTRWGFASLRELAIKSIKPPTSHDKLVLARTYSINHWVLPALAALCERTLPLSLDEARQMRMEDVILVATVREEIRGGALRVDAVDIPRHVAEAQLAKLEAKAYPETRAQTEAEPQKAKPEVEAKAKTNAEVTAERETEAIVERRNGAKAKRDPEAEAKEKAEAEVEAKREAVAKEKAEAEAMERPEADAKARANADAAAWEKAKARADAKVAKEYKVKAAEAKAAAARAELEAKQKAENERLEIEARSNAEAAKIKEKAEEVRNSVEVEKAELRAKQAEEQIARQRAADKARRAATKAPSTTGGPWNPDPWSKIQARGPDGSSFWSKAASAIVPTEELAPPKSTNMWNSDPWSKCQGRNASSPSMKPGGER